VPKSIATHKFMGEMYGASSLDDARELGGMGPSATASALLSCVPDSGTLFQLNIYDLMQELRTFLRKHRKWLASNVCGSSSGTRGSCDSTPPLANSMLNSLLACCEPEVRRRISGGGHGIL
jgi:hypothetical protein